MKETLHKNLHFVSEADRLKSVLRQSGVFHGPARRENSAEHSWHLAVAVYIMRDFAFREIQIEKALLLALFHDIVEIDGGDTFVYSAQDNKWDQEVKTLERLTQLVPGQSGDAIKALWFEYEENQTPEAQYVNALDRFLPIMANVLTKGSSWAKHQIQRSQVVAKNQQKIECGLRGVWPLVELWLEEAIQEGYLKQG